MKLIFYIILPIIIFSSCTKRVIEYSQSDEKKIKAIYNLKNGKKHGIQQQYYINGKIYLEETYVNGLKNGICKLYYEDGTLNSENIYINGKMDGLYTIYYDNGQIASKQIYNNGIKEGAGIKFNPNGGLWYEENYKDGQLDGIIKHYDYEDSKLERITEYQKGKRNGNETIYGDSGALWSISSYKLDKRNGMTFFYWENGQIWFEIPVVNNIIVNTVYEYMPDGMTWREYQYNNGRQHGNQIYYFREYDSWIYGEFGNDYEFLIEEFGNMINNNYIILEFEDGKIVSEFLIKGYYNNDEKWLDANYLNGEIINGTIYKTEKSPTGMTEHGCSLLSEIIKGFAGTPDFENWIN